MIKVVQFIERSLGQKMPEFGVKFILVGSIPEGTRVYSAAELDITVQFAALNAHPLLLEDNPFELKVCGEDHPLFKWTRYDILQYQVFFSYFLAALKECVNNNNGEIMRLTEGRINPSSRSKVKRDKCPQKMDNQSYKHCPDCIFRVTQTKSGACLTLKWKFENVEELLTIDLIPVLPVVGTDLNGIFNRVTQTLFEARPPYWLNYLEGFIKQDRVLPESFRTNDSRKSDGMIFVGMKLLNYGPGNNFLVRPGQQLEITHFGTNPTLKKCYCYVKILKCALNVDLSSYFVKKVLLTDEMLRKSRERYIDPEKLLFEALHHPDLRPSFEGKIDYEKWDRCDHDENMSVPLLLINGEDRLEGLPSP